MFYIWKYPNFFTSVIRYTQVWLILIGVIRFTQIWHNKIYLSLMTSYDIVVFFLKFIKNVIWLKII
jgi:hypothetical protein